MRTPTSYKTIGVWSEEANQSFLLSFLNCKIVRKHDTSQGEYPRSSDQQSILDL